MTQKQTNRFTDFLPLAKKMIDKYGRRKLKMDFIIMVKLWLYGNRIKHLTKS